MQTETSLSPLYARVGKVYAKCENGKVCKPVEGSFVAECEDCKRFE